MKSCHEVAKPYENKDGLIRLVLVGNPNVGKSIFFNALTGIYVDVSNFPGTTVDISRGKYGKFLVEDTPGVYGVSSFNDEERVARDVIINGDIILNVVDAVHLHRDLFLTQQLIDMGKRVIVALNLMDEAVKNGIHIDSKKLAEQLGVPVIPTSALKNEGVDTVKNSLELAGLGNRTEGIIEWSEPLVEEGISEADAVLILESDINVSERNNVEPKELRDEIYKSRRQRVDEIVASVVSDTNKGASVGTIIGRMMLKPITGIPILFAILFIMFEFIGVFVAQSIVGITEGQIMAGIYQPAVIALLEKVFPLHSFLGKILIGEFGLLTMTPVYVIGLLLPLVVGFYWMLSLLEDSGLLPRIAVLSDRLLTGVGLNGRAIIPIILGFGCITMATMTTRLLGSRRERVIATALLGLTIPCSAQFGVIVGLLSPLGAMYTVLYCTIIILIFGLTGAILNKFLPGESTHLLIDLPPVRMPVFRNVLTKTFLKSKLFIWEAAPLFALGALIISVMQYTGLLVLIQEAIAPITVSWMMLPKEAATVFIMGIVRRDFGAAGLSSMVISAPQMLTALVTITLFVPCIASIIVMFKERTKLEAAVIWFGSFAVAFITGGLIARMLLLF